MNTVPIRRLAAGMAVALTLGLVAGCGNITTPATSSTSSASGASATSGAAAPASSASSAATSASSPATVYTTSQLAAAYQKVGVKGTPVTVTAGKTVSMQAKDLYFSPNTLTVAKGTKVTISLSNQTPLEHTFTLTAFHINQDLTASGGTATVSFTPTAAGTYYWYCAIPGHADSGMVGKVVVQ